ncbi:MAG: threonylcarbamoyl-AMP synthase [Muribaculaceae bacterium]|nr:threonylcarbamoyl-AMP synthase [Muribaculaceae bacterium]
MNKEELFNEDISNALLSLNQGNLILYPTDTIWGIGCDATNPEAVKKIFNLKQRTDSKSMIVLVDSQESLNNVVKNVPETAIGLINNTKTPLTIIYDDGVNVADNLKSEDNSLAVRITDEIFSKELCHRFGKPIVSTSANISGNSSPSTFHEISEEIKKGVGYIVRYRQDDHTPHIASRIIKVPDKGDISILR